MFDGWMRCSGARAAQGQSGVSRETSHAYGEIRSGLVRTCLSAGEVLDAVRSGSVGPGQARPGRQAASRLVAGSKYRDRPRACRQIREDDREDTEEHGGADADKTIHRHEGGEEI